MRIWLGIGLLVFGCGVAGAQSARTQPLQSAQPSAMGVPIAPNDPDRMKQERQRDQMMVDERRKRLLNDTDKLLALATQLKADVDRSTKNELSIDVIKKAAEIEKLAHDVKERMRN